MLRALALLFLATLRGASSTACSATVTSQCCGDDFCDGPETPGNCAADCGGNESNTGGNSGGSSNNEDEECTTVPSEKPTTPTLCTAENQGCCDCGSVNIKTYVFWPGDGSRQYCFHAWNLATSAPAGGPRPVVLHMDGYSGGGKGSETGGDMGIAADYYGFTTLTIGNLLQDGAGYFGLQFGNNNIANDQTPTPCSSSDSREIPYLTAVFQFIADNPTLMDSTKVYTEGFSQNSMFAIYTAVCFADKVAGAWQGGSGLSKTGHNPVAPGFQGQCTFSSYAAHGDSCCDEEFCSECKYWPLYPRTCSNKIVDCIAAYTDDTIACGSDWYMYEAMVTEGNDARLLSFPGNMPDGPGGHIDPKNKWAWAVGCLGIVPSCSSACATSFGTCVDNATDATNHDKFKTCEDQLKAGSLSGCTVGCAPTLAMLRRSEDPVVTLSQGKFGTETGLEQATGSAPHPSCKADFGVFSTGPGPTPKCIAPSSFSVTPEDPAACGSTPAPTPAQTPAPTPAPPPAPTPDSTAPAPTPAPPPAPTPNSTAAPTDAPTPAPGPSSAIVDGAWRSAKLSLSASVAMCVCLVGRLFL